MLAIRRATQEDKEAIGPGVERASVGMLKELVS
jgi:hypothetical protein